MRTDGAPDDFARKTDQNPEFETGFIQGTILGFAGSVGIVAVVTLAITLVW